MKIGEGNRIKTGGEGMEEARQAEEEDSCSDTIGRQAMVGVD